MNPLRYLALLAGLCPVLSASGRQVLAVPEDPGIAVRSAIQERRKAIPRFRCHVAWVQMTPRTTFEGTDSTADGSADGDSGPLLIDTAFEYAIQLSPPRLRVEERGQTFSDRTKDLIPKFAITLFDGRQGFYLHPEESAHGKVVNYSELTHDVPALTHFASPPLLWPFGLFGPLDFTKGVSTSLTGEDCQWEADGETVKLTRTSTTLRMTYVFDPAFGNNVVHCEVRRRDIPSKMVSEYHVKYMDSEHGWLPSSWTVVHSTLSTQSYRVSDWEFPSSIDAAEFEPPKDYLQPGMTVAIPGQRIRMVAEDGSIVSRRSGALPLQRTWSPSILFGAVIILSLMTLWFCRHSVWRV